MKPIPKEPSKEAVAILAIILEQLAPKLWIMQKDYANSAREALRRVYEAERTSHD